MSFRIESDSIGSKEIYSKAYYGIHSLRASENFQITGQRLQPEFIKSLAAIKKAAAITNYKSSMLSEKISKAICIACDEIISGKLHDQFIIDPIQGGAGTSTNMNANEVIANRAIEILGGKKGNYSIVHPNNHVNMAQSTNDVIPTAGRITSIKLLLNAINELKRLERALHKKELDFYNIIKMGRTQMQDAVPIRLGQEFGAYSQAVNRDLKRLDLAIQELSYVNIGGTAIGTCINTNETYLDKIIPELNSIIRFRLIHAKDLVDATQNLDGLVFVSSILKTCAVNLSKMSNDLRIMSSGPRTGFYEINLPPRQNGSSIMPGKVNPVIPEVMSQIAFNIIGNDVTITMAAEAGQLELNAFEPILLFNLFESIITLTGGVKTLVDNCIVGITPNKDRCASFVNNSIGIITAVCPELGYQKASEVAKSAIKTGKSVREILKEDHLLSDESIDEILNPEKMV